MFIPQFLSPGDFLLIFSVASPPQKFHFCSSLQGEISRYLQHLTTSKFKSDPFTAFGEVGDSNLILFTTFGCLLDSNLMLFATFGQLVD